VGGALARAEDSKSVALRIPFLALGCLCVGLGYLGVIVPGMPSTIFFICAVWAFKRSSPRFENWLLNHRVFGPTLRDWDEHRAIRMTTKVVAISVMLLCSLSSLFFVKKIWVQALIGVTVLLVALYIATRRTKVA
jgi:uncharacterized protein